jgi:hypothetical protein
MECLIDLRQSTNCLSSVPLFQPSHFHYIPEHGPFTITFPPSIRIVKNIRTSHPCRMVYYRQQGNYLIESPVTSKTIITVTPLTSLIIYIQKHTDMQIHFKVELHSNL